MIARFGHLGRSAKIAGVGLAAILAVLLWCPVTAGAQDKIAPLKVHVGEIAPDFALPAANGTMVRLSSYRGHNVLIDFYRGYW